jgi:hypothetical protein
MMTAVDTRPLSEALSARAEGNSRERPYAFAGMAKAFLLAAAVAGFVHLPSTGGTEPGAQQRCVSSLLYEGSVYRYRPMDAENLVPRRPVGLALRPGCSDIGSVPPPPAKRVEVFRFGTASPRVALTTREAGAPVYAVLSRCFGFAREEQLRCLQTEIRFRGRGYTALRSLGLLSGGVLGEGRLRGRPVRLRAIQGIDPRIALARAEEPETTFVAHRRCELQPLYPNFKRCLRAPLWLAVRGHTRVRSATIRSPGALLTSVRMRLFIAPAGVADQITSPDDERLTPAGVLTVDRKGRGSTTIAIVDSAGDGPHAVLAEVPGRRVVVVGELRV